MNPDSWQTNFREDQENRRTAAALALQALAGTHGQRDFWKAFADDIYRWLSRINDEGDAV